MSFYQIRLAAGQPFTQNTAGTLLLIDSLGAAAGVDVKLTSAGGSDGATMPNRQAAFRLVEPFSAATFTAAVDTTIGVFLSNSDVQLGITAGSGVSIPGGVAITNTAAARVPVDVGGAQINVTATHVAVDTSDAAPLTMAQKTGASFAVTPYQAQAVTDANPVAVGAAAGAVVAASAARRGLRLRNAGANPVAIGGAGVTFANAAVILQAGETWNENEAPGAAWFATCAAGQASTLNLQTIA